MSNRRLCAMKWNGVCPAMDKKLATAFNFSRSWKVITSHANLFEVRCNPSVSVDIGLQTCSCGAWQINSFPCLHVVCALKKSGKNLNDYVDRYYFVDTYREVYSKCINPVPTLSKADFVPTSDAVLLPPLTKRPPGRPRTERIPSMGFRTRKVTCSRCGKLVCFNYLKDSLPNYRYLPPPPPPQPGYAYPPPPYLGYQGYFSQGYPPPPPPPPPQPYQIYHCEHYQYPDQSGCSSFLRGWLACSSPPRSKALISFLRGWRAILCTSIAASTVLRSCIRRPLPRRRRCRFGIFQVEDDGA
ncbi:hypothetical protein Vadar_003051 [Vaccinium darrowii]|uniref:Uncharacterized protein n=1 Tax=Vaccinium darrowii TaxID=229202 RepID=A0ACB7Y4L6_9ERIC|nr:hypothetical protein Vadar_003051 [Vaccinium darrowii]